MHCRSTTPPGWGGFFIGMVTPSFLVVIDIINIQHVAARKPENHPPVSADRHCPKALEPAFERMQLETRQIHIRGRNRCIKQSENITQLHHVFWDQATQVVA